MKTLVLLFIAAFGANAFAQAEKKPSKIESSVLQVLNAQVDAWNRGDIAGFMDGYWRSDEMRFVSGNNVAKGWQAAYDRYKKSYDTREKMGVLSFSELDVTVLNKESAFVTGRYSLKRSSDEPTGLFTLIFRKIETNWRIVLDHTSS